MSRLTFEFNNRRAKAPTQFELKDEALKPCPFCGSLEIGMDSDEYCQDVLHWCCCMRCGVEGPARQSRRFAIKKWQSRG